MESPTSHLSWYKHEPLRECVCEENTNDEWNITRLYHEERLHKKYSGQMERLGVIQLNCTDRWEGSVKYWRMYNGFPAFWLAVFSMAWYKTQYTPLRAVIPSQGGWNEASPRDYDAMNTANTLKHWYTLGKGIPNPYYSHCWAWDRTSFRANPELLRLNY